MIKTALCVDKEELLNLNHIQHGVDPIYPRVFTNPISILSLDAFLMDRSECETDEEVIQILPYVVITERESRKILSYRRGEVGDENRLHNKCSIGFGGHIEDSYSSFASVQTRIEVLALSTLRELNEELGLELSQHNLYKLREIIGSGEFNVFYSERDAVSRVHLCVLINITVCGDELKKLEEGVICEPEWLTIDELISKHNRMERELEGWSEIALDFIN